jgi:glycosyltransferase involved in cell wall biosynthesis
MIFSILICTIVSRVEQFTKLKDFLVKQITDNNLENEVEILFLSDDKKYPVGLKRNLLIENSNGEFVAFVDDDDWVSDTYVIDIVNIIKNNPNIDCIGMKGILVKDGMNEREFIHSIKYKKYSEDMTYYYRPPNHINPIKREIINKFKFISVNVGEDTDISMRMSNAGVLTKEYFLNKVIYHYHFSWGTTEAQKNRR